MGETAVDDMSSVDGAIRAIKRPLPITALQINEPFEVVTTEGIMNGKTGDWVIEGVMGEVYVCPDEVFRRSYSPSKPD